MTYLIVLAVIVIVIILLIFVFGGLAVSKSKMSFIEKANQIKKGMTLEEVISIMGDVSSVNGYKYRWERFSLSAITRTLYLTVFFENGKAAYIDNNFENIEESYPHAGLYGTYKMVPTDELEIDGKEIGTGTLDKLSEVEKNAFMCFIQEIKEKADTVTINKERIKFSGKNVKLEFEYRYIDSRIIFERSDFPFHTVDTECFKFDNQTPIYQLRTGAYFDIGKDSYLINFYYS